MTDRIIFAFDKKTARSFDADGRMRVKDCVLSTAEVNPYRGDEIPGWQELGLDANKVYELYRSPEELKKAVESFQGVPLMIKHIPQTAEEPRKEYQAGAVHSVRFEGKYLRGDLLVSDGRAIELIEADELADLSCGYRYKPNMRVKSADGKNFDGSMEDIGGNHVALVDDGRATGAHVADSALRNPQTADPTMQQGVDTMPLPVQNKPAAHETAAGENAPPAAGAAPDATGAPPAAPAAPGAAEGGEQVSMAAIGQALKHIATCLEALMAKGEGAEPAAADGDEIEQDPKVGEGAADEEGEGAMDEEEEGEGVDPERREAEDMELDPAVREGHEGAMDEEEEGVNRILRKEQDGTGARGGKTIAMDANSIRKVIKTAVLNERARAAAVDTAKREVLGVLGPVHGMDSAAAIYRAALEQVGYDVASLPKAAGSAKLAWQGYKLAASAAAGVRPKSDMAMDAKSVETSQASVLAHLAKISVKG